MKRHWQKKPLLIRQALPGFKPLLSRPELFSLAGLDEVQSRLVTRSGAKEAWKLQNGPFSRKALPGLKTPQWTLLVQSVDLKVAAVQA